jgi:hypothetical protein
MNQAAYRVLAAAVVCLTLLASRSALAAPPHGYAHHHHSHHGHRGGYRRAPVYREHGYDFPGYYRDPYSYGTPFVGPLFVRPLFVDPRNIFGLQAAHGFWGLDRRPAFEVPQNPMPAKPAEPPRPRQSNATARERAKRYIQFGDARFAAQQYHDAAARYKKAISAAPDVTAAYFRRGHAELAMGQYARAADSYKAGLRIDPNWPERPFRFENLYGDNIAARGAHLEALAQAAERDAENADLFFLIGVQLHFSKNSPRAKVFFDRAARLAGGEVDHLAGFLPGVKRGQQDDAVAF